MCCPVFPFSKKMLNKYKSRVCGLRSSQIHLRFGCQNGAQLGPQIGHHAIQMWFLFGDPGPCGNGSFIIIKWYFSPPALPIKPQRILPKGVQKTIKNVIAKGLNINLSKMPLGLLPGEPWTNKSAPTWVCFLQYVFIVFSFLFLQKNVNVRKTQ